MRSTAIATLDSITFFNFAMVVSDVDCSYDTEASQLAQAAMVVSDVDCSYDT